MQNSEDQGCCLSPEVNKSIISKTMESAKEQCKMLLEIISENNSIMSHVDEHLNNSFGFSGTEEPSAGKEEGDAKSAQSKMEELNQILSHMYELHGTISGQTNRFGKIKNNIIKI